MAASQTSLLVIEGDDTTREDIVNYLNNQGYQTFQSANIVDGLALYHQYHPHVIVCDIKASNNENDHLLSQITDLVHETALIVISSTNEVHEIVEALRVGATDYLIKPIVDMDILGYAVSRSLDFFKLGYQNELYRRELEQKNIELKNNLAVLEHDQMAGRQVQFKMLPTSPLQMGDYQFSHRIFASLYLSGDFVEYFTVGKDHSVFFIADVSGHGASSAFVTVLLKNLFARKRSDYTHKGDEAILSPLTMLRLANDMVFDTGIGKHLTMCVGALHLVSGELRYSNAGHLPQPILTAGGNSQFLPGEGMPVGLFEQPEFNEEVIALPQEFVLSLFSDGILEIIAKDGLRAQEAFLLERLQTAQLTVEALAESLDLQQVIEFPDDIAALLISKGYH
ncbi:MAG: serine phosphatase RsbU (regulator of sigma subunit) [Pseudohongiellaceae bacterium]|jgi:serine phosphatase RsbU (regulator of sigma subunit)